MQTRRDKVHTKRTETKQGIIAKNSIQNVMIITLLIAFMLLTVILIKPEYTTNFATNMINKTKSAFSVDYKKLTIGTLAFLTLATLIFIYKHVRKERKNIRTPEKIKITIPTKR